jgi:hypothetical protein
VLRSILEVLAQALHDQGYLDLREAFIVLRPQSRGRAGQAGAVRSTPLTAKPASLRQGYGGRRSFTRRRESE